MAFLINFKFLILAVIYFITFSPVDAVKQFSIFQSYSNGFSHVKKNAEADKVEERSKTTILYGQASYYHDMFHGRLTANGEVFSQSKMTAACNSLPLGTWIKITNLRNNKSITLKTNDRLHPKTTRLVDLSRVAAKQLGFIRAGLTRVKVEVLDQNLYP